MFCKIILPSKEIHVFPTIPETFEEFHQMILNKFKDQLPEFFSYKYRDSDDELVLLSNDEDLKTAVLTAETEKMKNLRFTIVPENKPHISKNLNNLSGTHVFQGKSLLNPIGEGSTFTQIPLTESITELPSEKPILSSNLFSNKSSIGDSNPGNGGEITPVSETISQFCSPIADKDAFKSNRRIFFNGQDSIGFEPIKDEDNKEKTFTKEQFSLLSNIIDQSVQKHIIDKLQGILNEVVSGLPTAYKQGRNFKAYPTFNYGNILSPFGMRLSSKRCQELAQVDSCVCQECKGNIKDIRYSCLTCKSYNCCEKCEETVDHPHPLLKIRPSKSSEVANTCNGPTIQSTKYGNKLKEHNGKQNTEETSNGTQSTLMDGFIDQSVYKDSFTHGSASSQNYQHTNKLLETCDVSGLRNYKVAVIKESVYDVIRVKSQHIYNVEFTIKNTGMSQWSSPVRLRCINGIHKGEEKEIPHLVVGQEHVISLGLKAPSEPGRYLSQWKLHHYEESVPKPFGKVIYIEIDVFQGDKENTPYIAKEHIRESLYNDQDKKEAKEKEKERKHKEGDMHEKDQELMKEMGCSEEALKQAKILNDMFPGDVKEKVEFVSTYPSKKNINDLVSAYLDRLSASCKRRATGGSNLQRTNSVWL